VFWGINTLEAIGRGIIRDTYNIGSSTLSRETRGFGYYEGYILGYFSLASSYNIGVLILRYLLSSRNLASSSLSFSSLSSLDKLSLVISSLSLEVTPSISRLS
jgi:hypothetical protein